MTSSRRRLRATSMTESSTSLLVKDNLCQPTAIAEVDEHEPFALVSNSVDPASEAGIVALISRSKGTAIVRSLDHVVAPGAPERGSVSSTVYESIIRQMEHMPKPHADRDASGGAVLFTAFEPSGDALAAPVIEALAQQRQDLKIYAWGGPRMEAAGAMLVGRTADDGAMGLGAIAHARKVRKTIKSIGRWIKECRLVLHVPVDSPAANFPVCRQSRDAGARIVHLAAPQLWAWGEGRIKKLRRLTDHLLCLLPFEPQWFGERGVKGTFVGHPAVNRELDPAALKAAAGAPRSGWPSHLAAAWFSQPGDQAQCANDASSVGRRPPATWQSGCHHCSSDSGDRITYSGHGSAIEHACHV